MKQIELYAHSINGVDPKLVKASEESTITQLIEIIVATGGFENCADGEILVFGEDIEIPFEHHRKISECEIRHRHHVHLHSCRKVAVSVFYNGERHESFSPSTRVKRVLEWATGAFELSPIDAADKILVIKGRSNVELPLDAHIGSFAQPHHCSVELCLTAPVEIQG